MSVRGAAGATFVYEGDAARVKSTIAGMTTHFVGNIYEASGSNVTKYYYAGAARVAVRMNATLYYLLTDNLGSTTVTTDASGTLVSELRYTAWGAVRSGSSPASYTYTGALRLTSQALAAAATLVAIVWALIIALPTLLAPQQ